MRTIREFWQNLSAKSKKALIAITVATVLATVAAVAFLSYTKNTSYRTLFTGLSQEEAQQLVGLLQEQGVQYIYEGESGSVRVPENAVDSLRASLLSRGYPKSGFTYDMYRGNSGLMTTESDKKQYTLYDLQDRLGATIRLFDGVQDAKVTIAEGTEQTYAIEDTEPLEASASAVVTMQSGRTLSVANAEAIKNLIARSVRGMTFTEVSVFDAASMEEVGAGSGLEEAGSGKSMADLTAQVENNIAANIKRVLGKIYGIENVAVSVKGSLNMARLVQENTQYSVPEKVDAADKSGLLEREELAGEIAAASGQNAAGIVGADANADTPRYVTQDGNAATTDSYSNSSAAREWLYNVLKEQREISPGVLENATVAVVINTADTSIPEGNLVNLVADASGITRVDAPEKITILRAARTEEGGAAAPESTAEENVIVPGFPRWALIGAIASGALLLLLLLLLLLRSRKRKKSELLSAEELESGDGLIMETAPAMDGFLPEEPEQESDLLSQSDEHMERGLRLKKGIGEFADQNPQIVAKLLQGWIREEEEERGRKSGRASRK